MFDFNKCLEYIDILENTGAEYLCFETYRVGIDDNDNYYIDLLYLNTDKEACALEIMNEKNKETFKKKVADYFLGVDEK